MRNFINCFALYFALALPTMAQKTTPKVDHGYQIKAGKSDYGIYHSLSSKALRKDMPLLVFLPSAYKQTKKEYPVVYLLHGVNDQPITEEGIRQLNNPDQKFLEMADLFQVIIVTVLEGNSFYIDSPTDSTKKYATFTGVEVPAFIDKEYRTMKKREGRFLAGFSMGGYGAVSLLCRYPETFSVALNRAGVMDLAFGINDLHWDDAAVPESVLGSYWKNQQTYHLNGNFNLINKLANRKDVAIVIEVGREDFLYKTNRKFRDRVEEMGIPYVYAEYPGGHTWTWNNLLSLLSHLQVFRKTID